MKENKLYFVAMYLRISKEDETQCGKLFVSNSIESQRMLIRNYLDHQKDMILYDVYVDDGFSGSNFERPGFLRMMEDVRKEKVNCIIVKDLSRFGREYIEAGRYLEDIFPRMGVRFIAITDQYDSLSAGFCERQMILPVKNFINDSYCRDISVKVRSQLEAKRQAGECVSAFAVYGYQKDPKCHNRLVIDTYAAEVVKKIYAWKIEGMAVLAIADKLNECHILSPKEYKKSLGISYFGGFYSKSDSHWSSTTVKRILTDEVYLGHMIQGKTVKINYKVRQRVKRDKDEWIRVENTHEPIVSRADFETVRHLLLTDVRSSPSTNQRNRFSGILFCGDCREQMIRRKVRYHSGEKLYYICSSKNRGEGCSRHSIEDGLLSELIQQVLNCYVKVFLENLEEDKTDKTDETGERIDGERSDVYDAMKTECMRLKRERDKYLFFCRGLTEDFHKKLITEEEVKIFSDIFLKKAERLQESYQDLLGRIMQMTRKKEKSDLQKKSFSGFERCSFLDRTLLTRLVKHIFVYEDHRVEVELLFDDKFREYCTRK